MARGSNFSSICSEPTRPPRRRVLAIPLHTFSPLAATGIPSSPAQAAVTPSALPLSLTLNGTRAPMLPSLLSTDHTEGLLRLVLPEPHLTLSCPLLQLRVARGVRPPMTPESETKALCWWCLPTPPFFSIFAGGQHPVLSGEMPSWFTATQQDLPLSVANSYLSYK